MPISGFPDATLHEICYRCGKWHEPQEGTLVYPEATGPFSFVRRTANMLAANETTMRFLCHRCARIRRTTKIVIISSFLLLVALVLLLQVLGVLQ
jgi:hypothetical protein